MLARYGIVGVLSLVGTTGLVRIVGPADWAIASTGYFLIVFLDYAFGATFLGSIVRSADMPRAGTLSAARALSRLVAVATLLVCGLLAVPAAELYGRTEL